jgi:Fe2+ transport system protein FeoA
MPHVIPLEFLASGETGRVCSLDGDHAHVIRLEEMGLRAGVEVRMLRTGPPCLLAIDNQRITFRGEDAVTVLVEVTG